MQVSSESIQHVPEGLHFKTKEDFNVEFKGKIFASFKRYGSYLNALLILSQYIAVSFILSLSTIRCLKALGSSLVQRAAAQAGSRRLEHHRNRCPPGRYSNG